MPKTNTMNYHKYHIKLKNRKIHRIYMEGRELASFVKPDNQSRLPKLYVVKSDSEIVYVGQTTRNMRRRLYDGLQAQGKGGYHGYMWKDLSSVYILIWCFEGKDERYIETLEGELVFLLRTRTGQWPKGQMEIHFHNAKIDEVKLAEAILREAFK